MSAGLNTLGQPDLPDQRKSLSTLKLPTDGPVSDADIDNVEALFHGFEQEYTVVRTRVDLLTEIGSPLVVDAKGVLDPSKTKSIYQQLDAEFEGAIGSVSAWMSYLGKNALTDDRARRLFNDMSGLYFASILRGENDKQKQSLDIAQNEILQDYPFLHQQSWRLEKAVRYGEPSTDLAIDIDSPELNTAFNYWLANPDNASKSKEDFLDIIARTQYEELEKTRSRLELENLVRHGLELRKLGISLEDYIQIQTGLSTDDSIDLARSVYNETDLTDLLVHGTDEERANYYIAYRDNIAAKSKVEVNTADLVNTLRGLQYGTEKKVAVIQRDGGQNTNVVRRLPEGVEWLLSAQEIADSVKLNDADKKQWTDAMDLFRQNPESARSLMLIVGSADGRTGYNLGHEWGHMYGWNEKKYKEKAAHFPLHDVAAALVASLVGDISGFTQLNAYTHAELQFQLMLRPVLAITEARTIQEISQLLQTSDEENVGQVIANFYASGKASKIENEYKRMLEEKTKTTNVPTSRAFSHALGRGSQAFANTNVFMGGIYYTLGNAFAAMCLAEMNSIENLNEKRAYMQKRIAQALAFDAITSTKEAHAAMFAIVADFVEQSKRLLKL